MIWRDADAAGVHSLANSFCGAIIFLAHHNDRPFRIATDHDGSRWD